MFILEENKTRGFKIIKTGVAIMLFLLNTPVLAQDVAPYTSEEVVETCELLAAELEIESEFSDEYIYLLEMYATDSDEFHSQCSNALSASAFTNPIGRVVRGCCDVFRRIFRPATKVAKKAKVRKGVKPPLKQKNPKVSDPDDDLGLDLENLPGGNKPDPMTPKNPKVSDPDDDLGLDLNELDDGLDIDSLPEGNTPDDFPTDPIGPKKPFGGKLDPREIPGNGNEPNLGNPGM